MVGRLEANRLVSPIQINCKISSLTAALASYYKCDFIQLVSPLHSLMCKTELLLIRL